MTIKCKEYYEISWKVKERQEKQGYPMISQDNQRNLKISKDMSRYLKKPREITRESMIKTDSMCLALLMPKSLHNRIKFASRREELFNVLEYNLYGYKDAGWFR
jgi:hypothetical protein